MGRNSHWYRHHGVVQQENKAIVLIQSYRIESLVLSQFFKVSSARKLSINEFIDHFLELITHLCIQAFRLPLEPSGWTAERTDIKQRLFRIGLV